MKPLLLLCALGLVGCAHVADPAARADAPAGTYCRADENFENGRCSPRIPGDGKPPGGIPPWTRP